jgi:hypothetical protein
MKAKRSELADEILQDETLSRLILDKILSCEDPDIKVELEYKGFKYRIIELK